MLPLVALDRHNDPHSEFTIHDSVGEYWVTHPEAWSAVGGPEMAAEAVDVLTSRGSLWRAASVVHMLADTELTASWLLENGADLLMTSSTELLDRLIGPIPLSVLFARPRLLLIGAAVAAQAGRNEDALARSRAAMSLAEHEGDLQTRVEALSRSVHCLCNLGQFDRATELSSELMKLPLDDIEYSACSSALLALGIQAAARGEYQESELALSRVLMLGGQHAPDSRNATIARTFSAIIPGLSNGDFAESAQELAPSG